MQHPFRWEEILRNGEIIRSQDFFDNAPEAGRFTAKILHLIISPFLNKKQGEYDVTTLLKNAAAELSVDLTPEQNMQFMQYKNILLEWNQKMNLTAITEDREIVLKHFADSLSLLTILGDLDGKDVIDVGTGAGFPGIPLKIAQPGCRMTLLDSLNKRLNFLRAVGEALELCDISYVHGRAEETAHDTLYREKFDFAFSRAVASLPVLIEYCLGYVRVGGLLLAQKGPDAGKEIQDSAYILKAMGGEITKVKNIHIPFTDINHTIVVISKLHKTPAAYPRKQVAIAKRAIK